MFFPAEADGETFNFTDEELIQYVYEAVDGDVPQGLVDALRIAQIFWNSNYTPEQQQDMTQYFGNMMEQFGQLYPTLEENITSYEQASAFFGGEESEQPDPVAGYPFAPGGPSV